jgi:FtsH-binding integral membrane protein
MACTIICGTGMFVNASIFFSGFLAEIASMILMIYLVCQVANRDNSENFRMGCLAGIAFQLGFLVGPVMHHIAHANPQILIQAVAYTACAFTSFTAISLFSKRRSYLFLGGIIMTMVNLMFTYKLMSWMFGYGFIQVGLPYLMFSLFVTCLFIIYDTQLIVERAESGDKDVAGHTMMLFFDLFELFIKIVQILMKLNEDKKNKD